MIVKTRFAPSPTGYMHLGNARTALFNALFAWQEQGIFLLRIEDTDQERSTSEFAEQLMQDLQWLGLAWQEGPKVNEITPPYYQAQRGEIYARYYQQLIDHHQAYPCFCSAAELSLSRKLQRAAGQAPRYAGTCAHLSPSEVEAKLAQGLQPTLRFRVPKNEKIIFTDIVRGEQQFISDDIGDFIIRRADGTPAFFFCNAIDDALMQVTKALRGEDHLTNTPRQLMILTALNLPAPQYGHFSLILGHDGAPLSKRNGSMSIKDLREQGWLSLAVVNYLARLGHSYTEESLLSLEELARQINDQRLGHAPSRFDPQHLTHWQQLALSQLTDQQWWQWLTEWVTLEIPSDLHPLFINAVRPNVLFPQDAQQWAEMILTETLEWSEEAAVIIKETDQSFFNHALIALHNSQGDYPKLVAELKQTSGVKGKKLFMPLRAALTGVTHGPEMAYLLPLIGIHRAEQRLSLAAQDEELI